MKKSQVANQVFVYVLAAIVFSMVLMYGYKAINNFASDARYVSLVQLKTDLESSINDIASTQNVKLKTFRIPSDFRQLCFFDSYKDYSSAGTYITDCSDGKYDGVTCDAWESNTSINGFLSPIGAVSFKTVRIELTDSSKPIECFNITAGKIKLRLQGKGDRTVIREVVG
jgi:hypothetical protein